MAIMSEKVPDERAVLARIRTEMEQQLRTGGAPEEVHSFLVQHWARLMLGIYLAKGNQDPDWQAGWDTVSALLWSLSPKQGREDTAQMLRTLPTLLARLQEGCIALAMPLAERDALFKRLALLHAAVAREGLHSGPAGREPAAGMATAPDAGEGEGILASLAPAALPMPARGAVPDRPGGVMPKLGLGNRVRFLGAGENRELLVHWISPMGGMYLFTNSQGLEALTLTRARLEAKFRAGEAQLAGY